MGGKVTEDMEGAMTERGRGSVRGALADAGAQALAVLAGLAAAGVAWALWQDDVIGPLGLMVWVAFLAGVVSFVRSFRPKGSDL
jgi:hypothetical protein